MITLSGIKMPLGAKTEDTIAQAAKLLGNPEGAQYALRRVSYDLRRGRADQICSVTVTLDDRKKEEELAKGCSGAQYSETKVFAPAIGGKEMEHRPVIVGLGPAGLFAAYLLSEYGYRPVVLERGADVDRRVSAVEGFFSGGTFDTVTNVQFGEGGAGTFSDGKLTTRINDEYCDWVLDTFIKFGAPEEIRTKAKPHIGTDNLRAIVKAMREKITENGGEVRFLTRLDDICTRNGKVTGCVCGTDVIAADTVVLACGHSARDTFSMVMGKGVVLTPKPFSVGVRIEHRQEDVDRSLYGKLAGDPRLPKGEYALSAHVGGRGVYTFCMCPGGSVVAAASEELGTVTNGMSNYKRDGENANSAVCVSVDSTDFGKNPMKAIQFQRDLERVAYSAAGGNFAAPASNVSYFLEGKGGLKDGRVKPTYPRELRGYDLEKVLGTGISETLRAGLRAFSGKLSCFSDGDAILTGVETRTSSPVRIERGENRQATGLAGLYPCGEGAGYAGGIMSSAVDGLRTALEIMKEYRPKN